MGWLSNYKYWKFHFDCLKALIVDRKNMCVGGGGGSNSTPVLRRGRKLPNAFVLFI